MRPKDPKYWDSDKGYVLQALTIYGSKTLSDIEYIAQQALFELNTSMILVNLEELIKTGEVTETKNGEYIVKDALSEEYLQFEYYTDEPELPYFDDLDEKTDIISQTLKWLKLYNPDIYLDMNHFYLEGQQLDSYSKFIISKANEVVIVANPFIDFSTPIQMLIETKQKGKRVVLITRPHKNLRVKQIHKRLKNSGISLLYYKGLHAKILVIDNEVSVVSSMNLIKNATAGLSWEAGIVTIDKNTVDMIKESLAKLNPDAAIFK